MEKRCRVRLDDGYALRHDGLVLLVPDFVGIADALLGSTIAKGVFSGKDEPKMSLEDWQAEISRLGDIVVRVVSGFPDEFDVFDYLPLTRAGRFPGNKNPLIADSACTVANLRRGGPFGSYVDKRAIQIRVCPYEGPMTGMLARMDRNDVRILKMDWFDASRKAVPVFARDGTTAAPVRRTETELASDEAEEMEKRTARDARGPSRIGTNPRSVGFRTEDGRKLRVRDRVLYCGVPATVSFEMGAYGLRMDAEVTWDDIYCADAVDSADAALRLEAVFQDGPFVTFKELASYSDGKRAAPPLVAGLRRA